MKRNKTLLIALLHLVAYTSFACNSCSQVSVLNNTGYLLQNTLADYVSIQGQCANFRSQNIEGSQSNDNLISTELLLKKGISKRIYSWFVLPIHYRIRTIEANRLRVAGLGDVRFGMDYRFTSRSIGKLQWTPILSAGVKAATGHYEHYLPSQGMPRSFNLGTASWGGLINSTFLLQYKKWGGLISGLYFVQKKNKYNYHYGSQTSLSTNLYYTLFSKRATQLLPSMGFALDRVTKDQYKNEEVVQTGGRSTLLQAGLSAQTNRHNFSVEYRKPISQSYAANSVSLRSIYTARYTFLLKKQTTR